MTETISRR